MLMKEIRVQDAVGQTLCQDMMQIVQGRKKGVLFSKGHVIREEDVPLFRNNGRDYVFVLEQDDSVVHQNEAVSILYDLCTDEFMHPSPIQEGRLFLISEIDGLFLVNKEIVEKINMLGEVIITSRHGWFPVHRGDIVGGARVVPLVIDQDKLKIVREIVSGKKIFSILPFHHKKVGLVITGEEIRTGIVEDAFTPLLKEKLAEYDTEVIGRKVTDDNMVMQINAIKELLGMGADMIICTSGMSTDPDDRTQNSIRVVADRVIAYGVPVMPGSIFMLAYTKENTPIVGVSTSMLYSKRTTFDLLLPLLMADLPVEEADIGHLGIGGLCLNCDECRFPNCSFGKR